MHFAMKKCVERACVVCILVIIAVCFSIPIVIYATGSNAVSTQLLWTELYFNGSCHQQQVSEYLHSNSYIMCARNFL